MSRLMKATRRLDKAVGDYLGEQFFLIPVKEEGDYSAEVDDSRVGGFFYGTLMLQEEIAEIKFSGKKSHGSVANGAGLLKVGLDGLPENAEIKINDVIIAKERGDREFKARVPSQKLGLLHIELDDAG